MKKYILPIVLASVMLLTIALPCLAVGYTATINVINSGSTYTNVATMIPQDNSYYASHGYINSAGTDVRVKSGSTFLPFMLTDYQTWFVSSSISGSGATSSFSWSSGNTTAGTFANGTGAATGSPITLSLGTNTIAVTSAGNFICAVPTGLNGIAKSSVATVTGSPQILTAGNNTIIVTGTGNIIVYITPYSVIIGKGGYITVSDDASLELGDNFETEVSGYIDTASGSNKDIIYKASAFQNWVSATSTISSIIYDGTNTSPTSNDMSGWTNPSYSYDGNLATFANIINGGTNVVTFSHANILCNQITYKINGNIAHDGITVEVYYGSAWHTVYTGGAVTGTFTKNLPTYPVPQTCTDIKVTTTDSTTAVASLDIYDVFYTLQPYVSATVTSGSHAVKTTADATNLKLYIDGTLKDTCALGSSSVPDNSNDWVICQNNVAPYINYARFLVSGANVLLYQPITTITLGSSSYTANTITLTTGSATVTGSGTTFTASMQGGKIKGDTDGVYYTIQSVDSTTALTLTTTYQQTGGSGLSYTLNYYTTGTVTDLSGSGNDGTLTLGTNQTGVYGKAISLLPISSGTPTTVTLPSYDLMEVAAQQGGSVETYISGTALFTNGSASVTGYGTTWISTMRGGYILLNADAAPYQILNVTSATTLTLTANYTNTGGTGAYTMNYLNWGAASEDTLQSNNIFTPWWQPWASVSNIPLITFFLIIGTAALIAIVVLVLKYTQNQFIGAFVLILGEALLYKIGIYQWWFVVITAIICASLILLERKPAL